MWHRLNVAPAELRVYDTLLNGQAFGWRLIGQAIEVGKGSPSKAKAKAKAKAAAREEAAAAAAAAPVPPLIGLIKPEPERSSVAIADITDPGSPIRIKPEPDVDAGVVGVGVGIVCGGGGALADPAATMRGTELVGVIGDHVMGFRETPTDTMFRCHNRPDADPAELRTLLGEYFQLSTKLAPLYAEWGRTDARLRTIGQRIPGLRVLRQDPTECLFSFLCSSNNNISRICQMLDKFRATYGEYLCDVDEIPMFKFPTLDRMLAVEESELREMGFGYRAPFVTRSAAEITKNGGVAWLHEMRVMDRVATRERLQGLHGVGRKVADCAALFAMDKPEVVPVDTHVWHIACRDIDPTLLEVKSLTPKVHDRVMALFVGRYGGYAGWAHSLLFAAELPRFADRLPQELLDEMQLFREEEKRVKLAMKDSKASPTKTARSPAKKTKVKLEEGSSDPGELAMKTGAASPIKKARSPTKAKFPTMKTTVKMEEGPSGPGEPPAASTVADGGSGGSSSSAEQHPAKRRKED